jgi:hypothetical protein
MARARRDAGAHPAWEVNDTIFGHVLTVGGRGAALGQAGQLASREMRYDGHIPGTAVKQFSDRFGRWLNEIAVEAARRDRLTAHELVRAIEELVYNLVIALEENVRLQSELREAQIERDFLRRQAEQLGEALKTNRPSIAKAMLRGVGVILLAVVGGAAEGLPGVVHEALEDSYSPTVELLDDAQSPTVELPDDAQSPAVELLERCEALSNAFDGMNFPSDSWPAADE